METLRALLESIAPVFYVGVGLLLASTLGQIGRAYRRWARAFFRAEREMAAMELLGGLARAAFLLALGLGFWLLVGPGVLSPRPAPPPPTPTPAWIPSPTLPGLLRPTPAARPSPSPGNASGALTPPSPTPAPSPSPTPIASPTPPRARCPDPHAQIDIPTPGEVISQTISVIGTATHPDFQFYKLEINGPYTGGQWVTLGDVVRQPKVREPLWVFDPHPFFAQPGRYRLRVVVVDRAAQEAAVCEVPVVIPSPGG